MQYEINIRVDICWYFSLNWESFLENSWFNDAHNFKAFCVQKPYLSKKTGQDENQIESLWLRLYVGAQVAMDFT